MFFRPDNVLKTTQKQQPLHQKQQPLQQQQQPLQQQQQHQIQKKFEDSRLKNRMEEHLWRQNNRVSLFL